MGVVVHGESSGMQSPLVATAGPLFYKSILGRYVYFNQYVCDAIYLCE